MGDLTSVRGSRIETQGVWGGSGRVGFGGWMVQAARGLFWVFPIGLAGGANKVPNAERLELQRRGVKPILGNLANVGGRLPGGRRVDLLGELP